MQKDATFADGKRLSSRFTVKQRRTTKEQTSYFVDFVFADLFESMPSFFIHLEKRR